MGGQKNIEQVLIGQKITGKSLGNRRSTCSIHKVLDSIVFDLAITVDKMENYPVKLKNRGINGNWYACLERKIPNQKKGPYGF